MSNGRSDLKPVAPTIHENVVASLVGATGRRPRVIFFGMMGNFSSYALSALLAHDVEVCAVVLPASPLPGRTPRIPPPIQQIEAPRTARFALPLAQQGIQPSIMHRAWQNHIPVWDVDKLSHADTLQTLATYAPDILCVACFSLRIPRSLLALPRLACLNVHPSLLPANRGPVPLFWTFRAGDTETGVTIHQMDADMDSGAIFAQESITIPEGIRHHELEALCAQRGAELLAQTVWKLYEGEAISIPQDETQASYHSFPSKNDFIVPVMSWNARHIYNFIRGVGYWDAPITLQTGKERLIVRDVIAYGYNTTSPSSPVGTDASRSGPMLDGVNQDAMHRSLHPITDQQVTTLDNDVTPDGEQGIRVRCRDGWVKVMPFYM